MKILKIWNMILYLYFFFSFLLFLLSSYFCSLFFSFFSPFFYYFFNFFLLFFLSFFSFSFFLFFFFILSLSFRYDPVFLVTKLDGTPVWRRRHYRYKWWEWGWVKVVKIEGDRGLYGVCIYACSFVVLLECTCRCIYGWLIIWKAHKW